MSRILLLVHEFTPFRGGIATAAEGLAAGAAAIGHDVHVLAPDYGGGNEDADRALPFTVHRFSGDFCSILSIRRLTRFARTIHRAVAAVQPDLVHAADPQSQMAYTLLRRFGFVPDGFFTVHGTELLRYRGETMPRLWMHGAMRKPLAVATVSEAVRERLVREFAVDPARVFTSYPAIDPLWLELPATGREAVRNEWGADADTRVLITVARRVREKGHALVIDALSRLDDRTKEQVLYVVVGDGPGGYADELRERARSGSVRLRLEGPLDGPEAIRAMDGADLFIMPSLRTERRLEGFGLAYIEAGARGVSSLACATGGAAEAVVDNETGILAPEGVSAEVLAATVYRLLSDRERLRRLGAAARERALTFTRERHAREVYDRFLAVTAEHR